MAGACRRCGASAKPAPERRSARASGQALRAPETAHRCGPSRTGRRSDGEIPCRDHPLDQGKERPVRWQVSWLAGHSSISGLPEPRMISVWPSDCPSSETKGERYLAHRSQLQGQPRIRMLQTIAGYHPHRVPVLSPCGHRRDLEPGGCPPNSTAPIMRFDARANGFVAVRYRCARGWHRSFLKGAAWNAKTAAAASQGRRSFCRLKWPSVYSLAFSAGALLVVAAAAAASSSAAVIVSTSPFASVVKYCEVSAIAPASRSSTTLSP